MLYVREYESEHTLLHRLYFLTGVAQLFVGHLATRQHLHLKPMKAIYEQLLCYQQRPNYTELFGSL